MPDFLSQTFLGVPAIFGDDRRLTNYALLEGKVVFQQTAVAWTAVPQRLGHSPDKWWVTEAAARPEHPSTT